MLQKWDWKSNYYKNNELETYFLEFSIMDFQPSRISRLLESNNLESSMCLKQFILVYQGGTFNLAGNVHSHSKNTYSKVDAHATWVLSVLKSPVIPTMFRLLLYLIEMNSVFSFSFSIF